MHGAVIMQPVRTGAFVVIVVVGATLSTSAAQAAGPPHAALLARVSRITPLLPGWTSHNTPVSSSPCRVPVAALETDRISPTYYSPKTARHPTQVDLTVTAWRSATLA